MYTKSCTYVEYREDKGGLLHGLLPLRGYVLLLPPQAFGSAVAYREGCAKREDPGQDHCVVVPSRLSNHQKSGDETKANENGAYGKRRSRHSQYHRSSRREVAIGEVKIRHVVRRAITCISMP